MSWSRYEPPVSRKLSDSPVLPQAHVDLFDRPAANGPHPWPFGRAPAPDPAPALAAELAALREQARQDGLAAALAEARATANAEVEKERARWAAGLEALVRQTLEGAESQRRELVELACAVADAVLQTELESGKAIEALVGAAIGALASEDEVTLVLAPTDVERAGAKLQERWPKLAVRADVSLAPGAIRLDGAAGRLSTSIAERVARARALALGDAPGERDP